MQKDIIKTSINNLKKDDLVEGKIINLFPYVFVVELTTKRKGFIPIEELSWEEEELTNPQKYFKIGDTIKALVYDIDYTKDKKLILSRRLAIKDPWKDIDKNFKAGNIVKAIVKVVTKKTVFSEVAKAVSAKSWLDRLHTQIEIDRRLENETLLLPGDTILGKIYSIDKSNRQIKMDIVGNYGYLSENHKLIVKKHFGILQESAEKENEIESYISNARHQASNQFNKILDFSYFQKNIQNILIVDDDKKFCSNLKDALSLIGFHVAMKHSGTETINLFQEGKRDFDLVLLDVILQDMNGIKVAAKLRDEFSFKNIILMTGEFENVMNIERLPALDLLLKPFKAEEIINSISNVINSDLTSKLINHVSFAMNNRLENQLHIFEPAKYKLSSSYDNRIKDVLDQIIRETRANAGAIFSLDPITFKVELIESKNINLTRFTRIKYKLQYSPIKDVIIGHERIKFNTIGYREGKFRYLLKLREFQSCLGVEIDGIGGLGYCIFVFHNEMNHFNPIDEMFLKLEIAATKIGSIIKEKKFSEWTEKDQRFILDGQTLSALGHELKSKLTALEMRLFTLNALLDTRGSWDIHLPKKIKENISDVDILKEDMFNIVRDLLRFSKKDEMKEININESLLRAITSVQPFAREFKTKIEHLLADNLPTVRGLGIKLEQVFLNLLLNAIQNISVYRPNYKGHVYIKSFYENSDNKLPLKIEFTDTGPGVHQINFEKIFEPMFTTKPDGVGMGLAICKGIIDSFKGNIYVKQSIMFMGSTFIVELPISEKK